MNAELCGISRFEPVLMSLRKTNNPLLQLASLQFINAIVNTPEDIDFKIHLRNEFMRDGLGEMLMVSVSVQWLCGVMYMDQATCSYTFLS